MTVLAATRWKSNAAMIADCAKLGYLNAEDIVLDPTFGRGRWWLAWYPEKLVMHDRDIDGTDFRNLPYSDGSFDAIAYDPPYVSAGTRSKTGIPDFYDRYGMDDAPRTPAELQKLINDGLTEMYRLVKPRGFVLCKCADYVTSGKLWIGSHYTLTHGLSLGFELWDRLEHIGNPRPQPPRTRADGKPVRQQHARRNVSVLLVFRKGQ